MRSKCKPLCYLCRRAPVDDPADACDRCVDAYMEAERVLQSEPGQDAKAVFDRIRNTRRQ